MVQVNVGPAEDQLVPLDHSFLRTALDFSSAAI